MDPPRPQPVLSPITEAAIFLVLGLEEGAGSYVADALSDVSALKRSVGFRIPEGELTCIAGVGSSCWEQLYGRPRPAALHPLPPLAGSRHTAVSTPGDLFFHVRAHRFDLCFELVHRLVERLGASVRVLDEVHGFRSFDERDLLGFVDGTENPSGPDAAQAVLVGSEDPGFEGGSYVVVQKYLHDLAAWAALPVEQQERAIGRTKLDDIELADELKPSDSHVALNTILDEEGLQQQIVRLNMPFGNVGAGEFGTYFVGYARYPEVIEQMLRNMFIGRPSGNTDRILDFSTAVTGSLFFVPSVTFLDDSGGLAAGAPGADAGMPDPGPPDDHRAGAIRAGGGSLGIGGLRGGGAG
jgi:porphyrinogen peroxidase